MLLIFSNKSNDLLSNYTHNSKYKVVLSEAFDNSYFENGQFLLIYFYKKHTISKAADFTNLMFCFRLVPRGILGIPEEKLGGILWEHVMFRMGYSMSLLSTHHVGHVSSK